MQVYGLTEELDTDALIELDRAAEQLAASLYFRSGCDSMGQWAKCRPYVCANYFLKCDAEGTAPMPVCRSECKICLETCRYERTILAPGALLEREDYLRLGSREATADPMEGQEYDKLLPDYKCTVDRKLSGPLRDSILVTHLHLYSRQCTSPAEAKVVAWPLLQANALLLVLIATCAHH